MRIVLITRDRPELTLQTIETMRINATNWDRHELLVVFDGDIEACALFRGELLLLPTSGEPLPRILCTGKQLGVGGAKNFGAEWFTGLAPTEQEVRHPHTLMFSDNDMYYLPGWDAILEHALIDFGKPSFRIMQVGGWRHPYHGVGGEAYFDIKDPTDADGRAYAVDAVTGNCFIMRWADWLKYGPFDANAIGPGQSEDYALSQRIKAGGGIVATLEPSVAIHCGLANSLGEPATGWQEMSKMAEEQMQQHDINKIWLSVPEEGTVLLERKTVLQRDVTRPEHDANNPSFNN